MNLLQGCKIACRLTSSSTFVCLLLVLFFSASFTYHYTDMPKITLFFLTAPLYLMFWTSIRYLLLWNKPPQNLVALKGQLDCSSLIQFDWSLMSFLMHLYSAGRSTGAGWRRWPHSYSGGWQLLAPVPQFFTWPFIFQQSGSGSFTWWCQGFKYSRPQCQAFFKPLLVSYIANVPLAKGNSTTKPDSKGGEADFSFCQGYLQHHIVRA